jgi:hypothetical protein
MIAKKKTARHVIVLLVQEKSTVYSLQWYQQKKQKLNNTTTHIPQKVIDIITPNWFGTLARRPSPTCCSALAKIDSK